MAAIFAEEKYFNMSKSGLFSQLGKYSNTKISFMTCNLKVACGPFLETS